MKHGMRYMKLVLGLLLVMGWESASWAQWKSRESVLSRHTWLKIGVVDDGVYRIDYATLQSLGLDVQHLNPDRIRLYGNAPGILPESNSASRYDDLSEISICVTGSEDGSFDANDEILFYGKGPVDLDLNFLGWFDYKRNPYTDTIFYFLCVDADAPGLRIQENASEETDEGSAVVSMFNDCLYHESEELSPFASGRTWYGDLFTAQEGYKEFVFDVPDLITSIAVKAESKVLGRNKSSFSYNLKVNDHFIANHVSIQPISNNGREYGKEHQAKGSFRVNASPFTVRYELNPTASNPMVFVDYFTLSFWRTLRLHGDEMAFRVTLEQMETPVVKVQVDHVGEGARCWDVTDPMHPCEQRFQQQADTLFFGLSKHRESRFHLFERSGVKPVASCQRIPNQNLHGITDAVMLIITPEVFMAQSEALADFHRERDAMHCVVVDIREVYNEFGTGIPDPTALRDFIRMVYLRSNGNLKYVLLMGKGTHDYRCIKGVHNNYVPTYESATSSFLEVYSMCSDDYFALMDEDEGQNCEGLVDLGIGRIPITTPEQGDAVVAKILHYADTDATQGAWKGDHLFVADNDSKSYANYVEKLEKVLDTAWHTATAKKVYLDSYPTVNTSNGERVPGAHDAILGYFDKGVGVISYTGHGGVKGLSTELVLSSSDITALDNFDRLPFVHTATCEFSKFDNPTDVSAGELLLLNPNGGAIALLTSVRPTLAMYNQMLSMSLHTCLYDRIDQEPMRFGDIFRLTKSSNYSINNIVYVLLGDPALRFSYPSHGMKTESVTDSLGVVGFVAAPDGLIDTLFNGVMEVKVYDQKTRYQTLGQTDDPITYYYYNDVLYEGRVSVIDGRFVFDFQLPATVSSGTGKARLCYYAYDTLRKVEAVGVYDDLHLTAPDPMAEVDLQGPDIHFYWNNPEFESGDSVVRRGTLYADLFDEHGIYHYNVSIGRNIVLRSNVTEFDNKVLNDYYEPALDDSRRGRVVFPVGDLENGIYEFSLKAWDTRNNSSEVEITFVVEDKAILAQVMNYPNPFTDMTWFSFVHGDKTEDISVTIEVFDMLGRRVAMLRQQTSSDGGVVPPIEWNGCNDQGAPLGPGVYVYKITLTDPEGKTRFLPQRLVKK